MGLFNYPEEEYWWDLTYYYVTFAVLLIWIVALGRYLDFRREVFWGSFPKVDDALWFVKLFLAVWIVSAAINFLTFYPLGLAYPDYVSFWLYELPPVVYSDSEGFPLLPNALSFVSLVVLAPIVEEITFRGYLLHRWGHKYSLWTGITLSSVLFGIMHPDVLAAIFFGVVMCLVYLRTRSLYGPMLLHAAWNAVFWTWALSEKLYYGWDYEPSLEQFMDGWAYGIAYVVLALVFIGMYMSRSKKEETWELPGNG